MNETKQTIGEIYRKSIAFLQKKEVEKPEISVQYLLADILNVSRVNMFLSFDDIMKEEHKQKMREFIVRRARREPVQYITGTTEFYKTRLKLNRDVLIPRPETELLVDKALDILRSWRQQYGEKVWKVADLGCGSGNIAISVAREMREHVVITAVDISEKALSLARENAHFNDVASCIDFRCESFADFLHNQPSLDMVLANPPYIDPLERNGLQPEVKDFEPAHALFGLKTGLDYPLEIIDKTSYLMKDTFAFLMEIGWDQSEKIEDHCRKMGLPCVEFIEDFNHFKRILSIVH